ncbi:MAG: hypothetical protein C4576_27830 [Desulfobacteraceae bacterium]|nr:MAG: hypothetical protein C4576_27830 [Desulfobacteraceae bacterium]
MNVKDEWEKDPAVRTMRRIFAHMEEAQKRLLSALEIDFHDPRIRIWREKALSRFERCWRIASVRGIKLSEQRMATVYLRCLSEEMKLDGIQPDAAALQSDEEVEMLVKEAAN